MRHVLSFISTILFAAVAFSPKAAAVPSRQSEPATLKSQMEKIHEIYGVNFVYDSSIDLDVPYKGTSIKSMIDRHSRPDRGYLEECLKTLFAGTGIEYEIMKKYIVLTKADDKKKPKDYTIFIEEQNDTLPESKITVHIERQRNTTQTGLHSIDFRRFGKGFATLGSPDVIKEIKSLPGVSEGTELLSGMYVHGGDGSDNLFLLDGVPLYQVTHFGGLLSSFNTEMIDKLDFYKSGFPSRFGGKTSSVVDIRTRQGDMEDYHGSFNIGLLNGGIQFEGPIIPGKTSFNIGLRRSWFDVFTIPAIAIYNSTLPYGEKGRLRYAMTDFNASLTHLFNKDSRLSLNVYTGSDVIRYGYETLEVKYWEGKQFSGNNSHDLKTRWGNVLASLNWDKKFTDDLHLNTNLYYTQVNTKVGIGNSTWKMDSFQPHTTEFLISESNMSRLHDLSFKADLDWIPSDAHHVRAGASFIQHFFRQKKETSLISVLKRSDTEETYYNSTQVHERDSLRNAYNPQELAVYLEDEITVASWFKTNVGLRYASFITGEGAYHSVEPRAAIRLQMGPKAVFKVSYSEMSQFVHSLQANYLDIPMSSWQPSTETILPTRSRQVAGGFYFDFPHGIALNVEGYWKGIENMYEYCGLNSLYPDISSWENELMGGKGRSYGAEVELTWNSRTTDVSVYYTLSWTERFFKGIWQDWYPARNDNRHKITINASHRFSKRFDMYLAWNYHTGDRSTVPTHIFNGEPYYSQPYNYRLPDYHRLDVGFNFRKTTKRGNESIWNLSFYNAYCRMNPMFAMLSKDYMGESDYRLHIISAIPIIPSFSYTLRF